MTLPRRFYLPRFALVVRLFMALILAGVATSDVLAADEKADTHTVKKGPIKLEASLEGTFEPEDATEIVLRMQEWSELSIEAVAEHGATVKQGDVLLQLEQRKLDEAIRDLESQIKSSEIGVVQAELDLKLLEPTVSLDLAAARRTKEVADADLKNFLEVQREVTKRRAEAQVRMALNSLNNQTDELDQLEKMYKADDLTEESEEIVVKRQRDAVEMAKEIYDLELVDRDQTLKVTLPRQEEAVKEGAARAAIELTRAEATLSRSKEKKMLELQALVEGLDRSKRKLARMKEDQAQMKTVAAKEAVVYYGSFVRGQWTGGPDAATKLRRGGSVSSDEVIMTLVQPRSRTLRVAVAEKDLHQIRQGATGFATIPAYPDAPLQATVESVSAIPIGPGKLSATIKLSGAGEPAAAPAPGMSGTFKLTSYSKADAIAVPLTALQTEDGSPTSHYVTVVAEGKEEKRPVKIGKRNDSVAEITDGLKEGDVVKVAATKAA